MNYQYFSIENREGIIVLTIQREKALNALNQQIMTDLERFFGTDALQIQDLKGVIVTGAGEKSFVAGADISEFTLLSAETGVQLSKRGQEVFERIERFPKPVIALVNGFALGGGCELAMACHIRVATENAKFGLPEVSLGIIPGYGGTQRLVQIVGKGRALEMMMTGDMIDATTALQYGLVTHVVPKEQGMNKAWSVLGRILMRSLAVAKTVAAANAVFEQTNGYELEHQSFGVLTASQDFKEGVAAFLGKRKANFTGA